VVIYSSAALPQAALYVIFFVVRFFARRAKKRTTVGKYHAAVRPELVEGQAKRRLKARPLIDQNKSVELLVRHFIQQ
jgi:hypothetical protein